MMPDLAQGDITTRVMRARLSQERKDYVSEFFV